MSSLRPKWTRTLSILLAITMVFASSPMQALAQTERPDSDTVELQVSTAEILATMDKWQEASSDSQDSSAYAYEDDSGGEDGYGDEDVYGSEAYVRSFLAEMLPSNVGTQIAESVEEILATEAVEETVEVTKDPPEMVIQGEDGDRTETLDDESVQETFTVDKAIADLVDSLVLPFEEEDSVIMRTQLLAELEGKWLVKFFDSDDLGKRNVQALVVLDQESLDLDAFLINTSSRDITFSLTVVDEQGNLVELSDLSAILLAASREELTEEELERYRGTDGVEVEILGVTATEGEAENEEEEEPGNTGNPSEEEQEEEEPDPSEEETEGDGEEQPGEPDDENPGLDEGGDVSDSGDSSEGEETASDPDEDDGREGGSDVEDTSSDSADSGDNASSESADVSESRDSGSGDSGSSDSGDSGDSGSSDSGDSGSDDSDSGERYYTDIGRTLLALNAGDGLSDDNGSDDSSDSGSDDNSSDRSEARYDSNDDDSTGPADDSEGDDGDDSNKNESDKPVTGENGEGDENDNEGNDEDGNSSTGAGNGDGEEDSTGAGNSGEDEDKDKESEDDSDVEIESIDAIVVRGTITDTEDEAETVEVTVPANSFAVLSFGVTLASPFSLGDVQVHVDGTMKGTKTAKELGSNVFEIDLSITGTPQRDLVEATEVYPANVVIVLDMSGSMTGTLAKGDESKSKSYWVAARDAAYDMIKALLVDDNGVEKGINNVAVVGYGSSGNSSTATSAGTLVPFTSQLSAFTKLDKDNKQAYANPTAARKDCKPEIQSSTTNCQAGFIWADKILKELGSDNKNFIVFLSDGGANTFYDGPANADGTYVEKGDGGTFRQDAADAAVATANSIDAFIYTVGINLGTDTNPAKMMKACATNDSFYYDTNTVTLLNKTFSAIGVQIEETQLVSTDHEEVIITDPISEYVVLDKNSITLWKTESDGVSETQIFPENDELKIENDLVTGRPVITWNINEYSSTYASYSLRYNVSVHPDYYDKDFHKNDTSGKDHTQIAGRDGVHANDYTNVYTDLLDKEIEIKVPTVYWETSLDGYNTFRVYKQDENGKNQAKDSAVFALFDSNGNQVGPSQSVTNSGYATFTASQHTGYDILTLKEISTKMDGYSLRMDDLAEITIVHQSGSSYWVNIKIVADDVGVFYDYDASVLGIKVRNYPKTGSIIIQKYETGTENDLEPVPVQGAQFRLFNSNKQGYPEIIYTDANGIASWSGLAKGTYYVREEKAPDGYLLVPHPDEDDLRLVKVFVDPGSTESVYVTYTNTPDFKSQGDLTIEKYGEAQNGNKALQGVVFTLTERGGQTINLTTGNDGKVSHNFTGKGTWTLTETSVGAGNESYSLLQGDLATITVDQFGNITIDQIHGGLVIDQGNLTIKITNELAYLNNGQVTIAKTFPVAQQPLDNSDFVFTVSGNGYSQTFNVGADGQPVEINGLVIGQTYTITETAKTGYKLLGITGDSSVEKVSDWSHTFKAPAMGENLNLVAENGWDTTGSGNAQVQVKKSLKGGELPALATDRFNVSIWGPGVANKQLTLEVGKPVSVDGLIIGQTYYIEEASTTGYKLDGIQINGKSLSKDNTGYYFEVHPNSSIVIDVINEVDYLVDDNSAVTLKKVITNNNGKALHANHTFTFAVYDAASIQVGSDYSIKPTDDAVKISGLVAGMEYTIREISAKMPAGYVSAGFNGEVSQDGKFTAPANGNLSKEIIAYNTVDYIGVDDNNVTTVQKVMKDNKNFLNTSDTFTISFVNSELGIVIPIELGIDGAVKNVNGLIHGITYQVVETAPDGYKLIGINGVSDFSFTANKNSKLNVVVTNDVDYLEAGSAKVTISKEMVSGENPILPEDTFQFVLRRVGDGNVANNIPVYVQAAGQSTPVSNLIAGQRYVIEEISKNGYVLVDILNGTQSAWDDTLQAYVFTAPSQGSSNDIVLKAVNQLDKLTDPSAVTIQKVIDNGDFLDSDDQFIFEITDPTGKISNITVTATGGLVQITGLLANVDYIIREINHPVGYTIGEITGSGVVKNNDGSFTFTAPANIAGANLQLTATNSLHVLQSGSVMLNKEMVSGEDFLNSSDEFSFEILYANGASTGIIATVKGGTSVSIDGLIAGQVYQIVEHNTANYTLDSIVGTGVTEVSDGLWSFTAPADDSVANRLTITAFNRLDTAASSRVTIRKTILEGQEFVEAGTEFKFEIYDAGNNLVDTVTLIGGGGSMGIQNLKVGQTYTIKEISTTGYKLNGIQYADHNVQTNTYTFTVPVDGEPDIELVAVNEWDTIDTTGIVTLTKLMKSDSDLLNSDDEFVFYIDGPNVDNNVPHMLKANETIDILGLVAGQTYTITESTTGYKLSSLNDGVKDLTANGDGSYTFTAPPNDGTKLTLTATNERDRVGQGTQVKIVKKMADGIEPLELDDEFTINFMRGLLLDESVKIGLGEANAAYLKDIAVGIEYTIAEVPPTGYKLVEYQVDINGVTETSDKFTVSDGDDVVVTVINTRDFIDPGNGEGKVQITKAMEDGELLDPNDTFFVGAFDKDGNLIEEVEVKVGEYATFTKLVYGQTYTLKEAKIDGYVPLRFEGDAAADGTLTISADPGDRDKVYDITIVNTLDYVDNGGGKDQVTITKTLQDGEFLTADDSFEITAYDKFKNPVETVTVKADGQPAAFTKLVKSQSYTLVETSSPNGYVFVTFDVNGETSKNGAFTVNGDDDVIIVVTNELDILGGGEDGDVTIKKGMKSGSLINPDDSFEVTVTHPASGRIMGTVTVYGNKSVSLIDELDLVKGETYILEEAEKTSYRFVEFQVDGQSSQDGSFTPDGENAIEIVVVNELDTIGGGDGDKVTLQKVMKDGQHFLRPEFDEFLICYFDEQGGEVNRFMIWPPAGNASKVYSLGGLVRGQTYTITESMFYENPYGELWMDTPGYRLVGFEFSGSGIEFSDSNTFTITGDKNAEVNIHITVTNEWLPVEDGQVTIKKVMQPGDYFLDPDDQFPITISSAHTSAPTILLGTDETPQPLNDLFVSQTYKIEELLDPAAHVGYGTPVYQVSINGETTETDEFIVEEGDKVEITVINSLDYTGGGSNPQVTIVKAMGMKDGVPEDFLHSSDTFEVAAYNKFGELVESVTLGTDGVAKPFTKLVKGQTYTLEETSMPATGYVFAEFQGAAIRLNNDDKYEFTVGDSRIELSVVNNLDYVDPGTGTGDGQVTITKEMVENTEFLTPGDTFKITVYDVYQNPVDDVTVGADGQPEAFTKLVKGESYTLKESNAAGYQFVRFLMDGDELNGAFTVSGDTKIELTAVNTLDYITGEDGQISVVKAMKSGQEVLNAGQTFPVSALDQFGTVVETVYPSVNGKVTFTKLVKGEEYKLVEAVPEGYKWVVFQIHDGTSIETTDTFTPDGVTGLTITVVNELDYVDPGTGTGDEQVTVVKAMQAGQDFLDGNDSFTIVAKNKDGNEVDRVTVGTDGVAGKFTKLVKSQTYTLEELGVDGYKLVGFQVVNGGIPSSSNTFTVNGDDKIAITAVNELDYIGSENGDEQVTIVKAMKAGEKFLHETDTFTIVVKDKFGNEVDRATVGTDGVAEKFTKLVKSQTYTLEELDTNGYKLKEFQVGDVVSSNGEFTVNGDTKIKLTVVNTLDYVDPGTGAGDGQVTIVKEMVAGQNFLDSADTFQVTAYDIYGNAVDTVTVGTNGQATFTKLAKGQTYRLEESEKVGYKFVEFQVENGGSAPAAGDTFTVNGDDKVVITVVNELDYVDPGTGTGDEQVTVVKAMQAGQDFLDGTDSFTIVAKDKFGNEVERVTVGTDGVAEKFTKLVKSQTYTLEELDVDGYKLAGFQVVNGGISSSSNTFTVNGDDKIAITAVNELDYIGSENGDEQVTIVKAMKAGEEFLHPASDEFKVTAYDKFDNVVETVTVKVGETAKFSKLVKSQTYTLEETSMSSGYVFEEFKVGGTASGNGEFTVNGDTKIELTVVNTLDYVDPGTGTGDGQVTITKEMVENTDFLTPGDTFKITAYDVYQNPVDDVTVGADGQPEAFTKLVKGESYTLKESNAAGYQFVRFLMDGDELNGAFTVSGDTKIELTAVNTLDYITGEKGQVTIIKGMKAGQEILHPGQTFPVVALDQLGNEVETAYPSADGAVAFGKLVKGETYTLVEQVLDGYKFVEFQVNGDRSANGEFTPDGENSIAITVVNELDYVDPGTGTGDEQVTVVKAMQAGQDFLDSTDTFTIVVKDVHQNEVDRVTVGTDGVAEKFTKLVKSQTYTLEELGVDGYKLAGFQVVNGGSAPAAGDTFTVNGDDKVVITVVNELDYVDPGTGTGDEQVTVVKAMQAGQDFLDGNDSFTIVAKNKDGNEVDRVTVGTDGVAGKFTKLVKSQTYTLEELGVDGYKLAGFQVVNGGIPSSSNTFTVNGDDKIAITAVNELDYIGSENGDEQVTIVKAMKAGEEFLHPASDEFKVTAYDKFDNVVETVTVKVGETAKFSKLVKSQTYTLEETSMSSGYVFEEFKVGGTASGNGEFTVNGDTKIELTVVNTLDYVDPGTGTGDGQVTITKEMVENTEFLTPGDTFKITVYDVYQNPVDDVTVGADGQPEAFTKLVKGESYTLKESNAAGYQFVRFLMDGDELNGAFTVSGDTKIELTAVNTLDYITGEDGQISVVKAMKSGQEVLNAGQTFPVSALDQFGTVVETVYPSVNGKVTFTKLVKGEEYKLVEAVPEGYKWVVFQIHDGTSIETTDTFTPDGVTGLTITVVNELDYVDPGTGTGDEQVTVVKAMQAGQDFLDGNDSFTIVAKNKDGNEVDRVTVGTDGVAGKFTKLVKSQTYTLEELGVDGYKLVGFQVVNGGIPSSSNTFTVNGDDKIAITAVNELDYIGSENGDEQVTIVKAMKAGEKFLHETDTFTIVVKDKFGNEVDRATVGTDGVAEKFTKLVKSQTYTLEELDTNGYKLKEFQVGDVVSSNGEFTVNGDTKIKLTVVNTLDYVDPGTGAGDGQVTIVKEMVAGQNFLDSADTFQVTAYDIYGNAVDTVTVGTNGQATFTKLAKGQTYRLEESEKVGYKFVEFQVENGGSAPAAGDTFTVNGDDKVVITVVNELDYVDPGTGTGDEQVAINKVMTDGDFLSSIDTFGVVVKDKFGSVVQSVTLDTSGDYVALNQLVNGQTYTLEENVPDGYKLVGYLEDGTEIDGAFTVTKGKTIRLTVVNTLDYVDGGGEGKDAQITLTKEMVDGDYFLHPSSDEFEVTAYDQYGNPVETVKVMAGKTAGFSKLVKTQSYTLVETSMPAIGYRFVEFKVDGTASTNGAFTVNGDDKITLTVVNALNYIDGDQVKISKILEEEEALDPNDEFVVTAYDAYGKEVESVMVKIKGQEEFFSKLVKGETYTLIETKMGDAYRFVDFDIDVNGQRGGTFTVNGNDKVSIVTINALKKADISVIDITKLINDSITGGAELLREEFTINLLRDGNVVATGTIDSVTGAFSWNAGSPTDLYPATYSIEEVLATPTNFEKGPMLINGVETDSFEIAWDTQLVEVVINNYSRLTNGVDDRVTVQKVVTNPKEEHEDYFFHIRLDGYGEVHYVSLKNGEISEPITGLTYGATYYVSEVLIPKYYKLDDLLINGVSTRAFTVTHTDQLFEIVAVNVYDPPEKKDRDEYDEEIDEGVMSALSGFTEIGDDDIPLSDLTDIEDGQIPQAGGFAMETVGLAGIMVLILGLFLKRKRKDSTESGE